MSARDVVELAQRSIVWRQNVAAGSRGSSQKAMTEGDKGEVVTSHRRHVGEIAVEQTAAFVKIDHANQCSRNGAARLLQ